MEYLISNLWLVWLIISILCLILELSSGDFYVTCFAIGALVAMVSSFIGVPLWGQVIVFAVFSVASIFFIRPRLLASLHKGGEERESNADALVGREGVVTEAIAAKGNGYVKVDGDQWKAVAANGETIAVGERVKIVSMASIVVTVEKI